jgi:hypothetical protein
LDLACRDGVDIRPTLLRVLTDLYVQKPVHTAEEETQYIELATGLVDAVDDATRATVAATLRAYPGAPGAVLNQLAKLPTLTQPTGEAHVPQKPTPPPAARDELTELFFSARPDERRLILANLVPAAARPAPFAPAETLAQLESAALQRNPTAFSRTLAAALGVSPALAGRIARDASGEPLVVAARALGMSAAMLQRVLLFLNPVIGQSVHRVYDLAQLFDETTPEAAAQMAAIWRQPLARKKPAHEPVHWDDERRTARSFGHSARQTRPSRALPPLRKTDRNG